MIKNYWVTATGKIIEVVDHLKIIEDNLQLKYTPEEYYTMLAKQGYLRIVETDTSIIIGYHENRRVTDKLMQLLKDFSIEKKKELLIERSNKEQKVGFETKVIL
jgi:hypothetical protein